MRGLLYFKVLLLLAFCSMTRLQAQVNITSGSTAELLVQKLVGRGVTVSNAVLNCPGIANGIFTVTSSNLGLDSGIILTSGRAATAGSAWGANGAASSLASLNNGWPGDPDLNTLANTTTRDACILEFDIVPQGDTVKFDYVFGSEEYTNSTCGQYNDAFAFFISGPGINSVDNMALVPGTTIPVTVNSVNSGIPGSQGNIVNCTSMGPGSPFTTYYVNNVGGTTITYQGFTTVLTAVHAVQPCNTYHLKLTIADGGNYLYDSGVFIKAGSLETPTFTIDAIPATAVGNDSGIIRTCASGSFKVRSSQTRPYAQYIKYAIVGTAVNGLDYTMIADSVLIPANSQEGMITINPLANPAATGISVVTIKLINPFNCNNAVYIDSASLNIFPALNVTILNADTSICGGATISLRGSSSMPLEYNWAPANLVSNANQLQTTTAPSVTTIYTLTATLPNSGCPPVSDNITVTVLPAITVDAGPDRYVCQGSTVELAVAVPQQGTYNYSWQPTMGLSAPNSFSTTARVNATTTYTITVTDNAGCSGKDSVIVHLFDGAASVALLTGDTTICPGDSLKVRLNVLPGIDYTWTPNVDISDTADAEPVLFPKSSARYICKVTDVNGCADSVALYISVAPRAIIGLPEQVTIYTGEAYTISTGGNCSYFAWSPPYMMDNPAVPQPTVSPDLNTRYHVIATTERGCVARDSIDVLVEETIIDIPNAFTPGSTGVNSTFKIVKRGTVTVQQLAIYNRWGQKIFETKDAERGWDGTFNGEPQPMGVYIYTVEAVSVEGRVFKKQGNVTLIR